MVAIGLDYVRLAQLYRERGWVKFDARDVVDLPASWALSLHRAVTEHGTDVKTRGRGPGSLEPEETAGLDYRVLTTYDVRLHAPWLWYFYNDLGLKDAVESITGRRVETRDGPDALNINFMRGQTRYEWHTDPDPFTLLLYATKTGEEIGGGLMLETRFEPREVVTVYPLDGECILFDGSAVPHAVEPMRHPASVRVSSPMVYFPEGHQAAHDAATSAYLYGHAERR